MSAIKILGIALIVTIVVVAVVVLRPHDSKTVTVRDANVIRYLPLGDSYTIGESVAELERWPNQLAARYKAEGKQLDIIDNPSVTGYTTQDLIDRELPLVPKLQPDFVTILIGVNDYVQKVDEATFSQHLDLIISTVQKQLSKPGNIVLVTIPDYGKTPTGSRYGSPQASEAGIKAFNGIITQAAVKYKLPVADIFAVSQNVTSDPSLVAGDGLHPSGKQYTDWTDIIFQTLQANKLP